MGLTVAQQGVDEKTNEIPVAEEVLVGLVLTGRVVTMDALLTQRAVAEQVVNGGGGLRHDRQREPAHPGDRHRHGVHYPPVSGEHRQAVETQSKGHGRIERRRLTTSDVLVASLDWPGQRQVFMVERQRLLVKTGKVERETVYGVTSLSPERADARRLLQLVRAHWRIENRSHWVRDVTFDEDRSQVRVGSTPQVLAALRNAVIALLGLSPDF